MIDSISHIGIVVNNIESVVGGFCKSLGKSVPAIKTVEERKMKVAVVSFENCSIEFIEDMNVENNMKQGGSPETALIHHFCLKSSDIEGDMIELEKSGCTRMADKAKTGLRGKKNSVL